MEKLEVGFLEEALGGALGIGRVGNNDVEAILVVVEKLEAVANLDLGLGVAEALGHIGEVLLRKANDGLQGCVRMILLLVVQGLHILSIHLVNVAKSSLFDTVVLDNLAENTTVSTTNDKNLLRVGVGVHGEVGDHLLVRELVALSALDNVVQNQNGAVVGGLEDEDILVLALLVVQDLLNLEGHGLAYGRV